VHEVQSYKWFSGFPVGLPDHFFTWDFGFCSVYPYPVLYQEPVALANFLLRFNQDLPDGVLKTFLGMVEAVNQGLIHDEEFIVCPCPTLSGTVEPRVIDFDIPTAYTPWGLVVAQAIAEELVAIVDVLNATVPRVIWWGDSILEPSILHRITIPENPLSLEDIQVDSFVKLSTSCDTFSALIFRDSSFLDCITVELPEPPTGGNTYTIQEPEGGWGDIYIVSYQVFLTPETSNRSNSQWVSVDSGGGDQSIFSFAAFDGDLPDVGGPIGAFLGELSIVNEEFNGNRYLTYFRSGQATNTRWYEGSQVPARVQILGEFSGSEQIIDLPPVGSPDPNLPEGDSDPPDDPNQGPEEEDGTLWVVSMKFSIGVGVGPLSFGIDVSEITSQPYCAKSGPKALELLLASMSANLGVISFSYEIVGSCTL
jgi:hypothetical protein